MKSSRSLILTAVAGLALAATPGAAHAQSGWGLVGGVNFATLSGDDAGDAEHRTGFVAGVFGAFPLGQVLTFRPEVTYTQKGATYETGVGDVETELELDYIEIPVLLRIGIPGMGGGLHALAGPTLSFEVGCSRGVEGAGTDVSSDCDDDGRKSFLVGGQVGAGVDLPLGGLLLSLDGRYTFDIEDLMEEPEGSGTAADLSNRVWSVTASLGFPLGM